MYENAHTPPTQDERSQAGRALRKIVPRSSQAGWTAPPRRPDPVAQLVAQDKVRIPELVPIRHGRMAVSPFTFLRGAAAYRSVMAELATMTFLEIHYARVNVAELEQFLPTEKARRSFAKSLAKARSKDNLQALEKLTTVTQNGQVQIADQPPLVDHPPDSRDMAKVIPLVISQYRATLLSDRLEVFNRYHLVDTARKVVGVGSVGLDARIALFLGRDDQDPLFLQMKEARASVLAPYAGPSPYRHHGQRVVEGQRLMQAASDMFLGWYSGVMGTRRQYYVRQLRDMKGSADVARMTPDGLAAYAALCGGTLARSHARSGDPAMITGYLGTGPQFDEAIADFAKDYAVQTVADHSLLQEAITSGRITAIEGI